MLKASGEESERIFTLDDYGIKYIVLTDTERTLRESKHSDYVKIKGQTTSQWQTENKTQIFWVSILQLFH